MLRFGAALVALLAANAAALATENVNVFAVGDGTLAAFVDGRDVIAVGDHTATQLHHGSCLILIGNQIEVGTANTGTVIIPSADRKALKGAVRNALWLMQRAGKLVGDLEANVTALEQALDTWRSHCGGAI